MADDDDTTGAGATPPAEPPAWATDLQRAITELPGKLRAVVTDDDKNQIAESVHGLFERSGAFVRDAPPSGTDGDDDGNDDSTTGSGGTQEEAPPKKGGRFSKFAAWFDGDA